MLPLSIPLTIFLVYVIGSCLYLNGIPSSISNTYYLFEEKHKGMGWLFTLFCWSVAFTLLPSLLEVTDESYQFCVFLTCAGMGFVGAAPQFKMDMTGTVHYVSAAFCMIFSQLWAILTCWWIPLIIWLIYIISTTVFMKKHKGANLRDKFRQTKPMFWIEVASFTSVFAVIIVSFL